ncbi:hypothetical protein ACF1BU_37315 [Streptomyces sp. NPDC014724]
MGGVLKLTAGVTHDPTVFVVTLIVWNGLYTVAYMYFVAQLT